jgi:Ca2+-binding EF-hand superfamily protein
MCREADQDHDGGISLEEFLQLVSSSSADRLSNFESRRRRGARGRS